MSRYRQPDCSHHWAFAITACSLLLLCSCLATDAAKGAAKLTGKAVVGTAKLTGKAAVATGKAGVAGVKYATGRRTVQLEREGNSFYADVKINKKHKARLLLDTGATSVQISAWMARRLGISLAKAKPVKVSLADGSTQIARLVNLSELRVGRAKAKNVQALVIESASISQRGGLLGMSFLNQFNFQIDTEKDLLILRARD